LAVNEKKVKEKGIAADILKLPSPKERKEEMKRRGLDFEKRSMKFNILFIVTLVLYVLPTFAYHTQLKELAFFSDLQPIEFTMPAVRNWGAIILNPIRFEILL